MSTDRLAQLQQAIDKRSAEQLLRTQVTLQHYNGRLLSVAGTPYLNFSGNDYLGLATEPEVLQAYADGARDYGAGSTGSPLVTGQHQVHAQLCDALCDWLGTEQVMLFSSGFAANQTMLQTLAQKNDTSALGKSLQASRTSKAFPKGISTSRKIKSGGWLRIMARPFSASKAWSVM